MRYRPVILVLALVGIAGCGGQDTADSTTTVPETTTTTAPPTTTTLPPTTTTTEVTTTTGSQAECEAAMEEVFQTVDVVLGQIEEDPTGFVDSAQADDSLSEIFGQAGRAIGTACGQAGAPQAYSDFVVYLSDQKAEHGRFAGAFLDSLIEGLCIDQPFELTLPAQAVCRPFSS